MSSDSIRSCINPNGGLDVNVQDQTTDIIDYYLCIQLNELTLALPAVVDDYDITVTDGSAVTVGNYICIQEGARAFQAQVLSKATNVLTLDTPIDFAFSVAAGINERSPDLNVDGSVTPVSATLQPIPGGSVKWDIVRIIFSMTMDDQPDDSKFGDIVGGLTRGIVIRKSNGIHHTIFNAKTNGDLRERMYDIDYSDAANPPVNAYGVSGRRTFGGQGKNGVVIRLDSEESDLLEILIQDDLTALNSFRMVAQGHVVD